MIPATLVVECETAYLTIRAVSVHSLYMVLHQNSDFYNFFLFFSVFTVSTTRVFVIVDSSYCTIALWS